MVQNDSNSYLIGLDLGTSAIKGVLMSSSGFIAAREKAKTVYQKAEGGIVQFDADEFYMLTADVIRRLMQKLPEKAVIAGLSMSSASGNTLLIDNNGKPLLPVFSWMDTRVTDEIEKTFGKLNEDEIYNLIGWPLIKMFPLAHLAWLRCHEPAILDSAAKICMTTDYLNFRLTGCYGLDQSTATTFYLQDQVKSQWHDSLLEKLGIAAEKLPSIYASGTKLGTITEKASMETGLPVGTAVVLGSFDHPSAARGCGVLEPGQALISCGTSWVVFYPVKERQAAIKMQLLIDPFLNKSGLWGTMFSIPEIANRIDKYICRYISSGNNRYQEFDTLAAAAKPGADGLFINPMSEIQEMQIDNYREYSKQNIARALMEGTAFLLKSKMDELKEAGIKASSAVMAGGPSETYPWPQIVCDVLGIELSIINGSYAGAIGAAILAGIGAGIYIDEKDAFQKLSFEKTILNPDKAKHELYKALYSRFIVKYK